MFGSRIAALASLVCLSLVSAFYPILSKNRGTTRVPLVENVGLEPTTPGLQSRCSSQLSQSPAASVCSPGQTRTADPHIISVVL